MLHSKDTGWLIGLKIKILLYAAYKRFTRAKDTNRLKMTGWKKICHANEHDKNVGAALYISDKTDFKTKAIRTDKEGYNIMIKGRIQEEDITLIIIYVPSIGALKYIKYILKDIK